jgi:uncharacterized SAM-binding protein YcdF (DUF218 family)
MFWLKKAVSYWFMPLPFCMAFLIGGVIVGLFPSRRRLGFLLVSGATALLLFFSNRYVSLKLASSQESRYAAIPEIKPGAPPPASIAGCTYVAVLGSGNSSAPGVSATGLLFNSGLARLVEAVRVTRNLPHATLIVSGPGLPGMRSHASVLAAAAVSLGIDPSRIVIVDTARDTEEESRAIARLVGAQQLALVTSAWHMPRAARLFRHAGVHFVPCPTDFISHAVDGSIWANLTFDSESLQRSTQAVHEFVGQFWLRMRGIP